MSGDIESEVLIAQDDDSKSANGKVLELEPTGTSSAIRWACKSNLPDTTRPKVCMFDDSVGGIADGTAWASLSDEDRASKTACWSESVAASADDGNGWVVGENSYTGPQNDVREAAAYGSCCIEIYTTHFDETKCV